MDITLIPIGIVNQNEALIYAPSRIEPPRQITEAEFMKRFADGARAIPVSFELDGKSNPQPVTAYGYGMDCWWIVGG